VSGGVGERLHDDPVGRDFDGRGKRRKFARFDVDRKAGKRVGLDLDGAQEA